MRSDAFFLLPYPPVGGGANRNSCAVFAPFSRIIRIGVAALAIGVPSLAAADDGTNPVPPVSASETAWIDEWISTAGRTGRWSPPAPYNRTTGCAKLDGEYVFTPNEPSAGNYVTVQITTTFPVTEGDAPPDADAQCAVRLSANGSFQVWTGGPRFVASTWLDVAADGMTPVADEEYSVSFVINYEGGVYSVAVRDKDGVWRLMHTAARVNSFQLAAKARKVETITIDGMTTFRSMKGTCSSIGSTARRWSKSNSPQASTRGVGANRTIRRVHGAALGQIEQSADANARRWAESNSPQASTCGVGANRTVRRLQCAALD